MDAVILVGGGGTRLRPLTYAVPKPLIPVLNKPLVAHLIANLARHGVENVVLAASATEKRIEAALGDGYGLGVHIAYAYEEEPLGSGLAVKAAAKDFEGPFFVCNGDVITDLDLSSMAQRHRDRGATLSISLSVRRRPQSASASSSWRTATASRASSRSRRAAKRPAHWANAGTWIFEPEVLDHIPDERMDGSLERLVFPSLIADGFIVQGFPSDAYWMDVGTSERYMQLHRDILADRLNGWLPEGAGNAAGTRPELRSLAGRPHRRTRDHGHRLPRRRAGPASRARPSWAMAATCASGAAWSTPCSGATPRSAPARSCATASSAPMSGSATKPSSKAPCWRTARGSSEASASSPGARLEPDEVAG